MCASAGGLGIIHAQQLLTLRSSVQGPRSGEAMKELGIIYDGAVMIQNGRIQAVGTTDGLMPDLKNSSAPVLDVSGKVVLPGFIDPHTHLIFGGSREDEYIARTQGASYQEIQRHGGGILETVRQTRKATDSELLHNAVEILRTMSAYGTTTVEVKSGYGLDLANELRLLTIMNKLGETYKEVDAVPTFCAHTIAEEYVDRADEYVDFLVARLLPAIGNQGIAEFCDVYCDSGNFSAAQAGRILDAGKQLGLAPKIHADAFEYIGASDLAAEIGAASADHLTKTPREVMKKLAQKRIVGVLMPAMELTQGKEIFADARSLISEGIPIALSTDLSPACWTESMQLVIALACLKLHMTPEEALTASTINAACAIKRQNVVGTLDVGKQADLIVLDIPNYKHIPYRFGVNLVSFVIKNGVIARKS